MRRGCGWNEDGNRTSMFRFVVSVVGTSILMVSAETTRLKTTASVQQQQHETNTNDHLMSIPLIPHHVQKARRRLERLSSSSSSLLQEDDDELAELEWWRQTRKSNKPLQYHRGRRLVEGSSDNADVGDLHPEVVAGLFQGYGTHYADLWCGTPPQRQTVIVDTGSGVTAFPCTGCNNCGVPDYHIDTLFVVENSSTFHKLSCSECLRGRCGGASTSCDITMAYQEGSQWGAYEVSDSCYVGGLHYKPVENDSSSTNDFDPNHAPAFAFDLKFGCQTRLTGLFRTQLADGIMGMDVAVAAYWKQMFDAGKIRHQAFSLCFSRHDTVRRTGTEAGAMTLGGMDKRLHNSPVVYTGKGDAGGSGFFSVHMRKIYLRDSKGGVSALSTDSTATIKALDLTEDQLNMGRIIVDSGTTDTYFSRSLTVSFNAIFRELTGKDYTHDPIALTDAELDAYPTILFQLAGDLRMNQALLQNGNEPVVGLAGNVDPDHPYDILIAMPPRHYFEFDEEEGKYQARFYTDEGGGGVLGANAMMGHDVFFDVENSRLGWAESTCDYTSLLKTYGRADVLGPLGGNEDLSEANDKGSNDAGSHVDKNGFEVNYFCKGFKCQIFMGIAAVILVVIVAIQLLRRLGSRSSTAQYHLPGELELQEGTNLEDDDDDPSSPEMGGALSSSDDGDDSKFVTHYRDRPTLVPSEDPDA